MRRQLDAMHISGTWQVCTEERLINENNKKYDRQNNTILPAMSGGYGYAVLFLFLRFILCVMPNGCIRRERISQL